MTVSAVQREGVLVEGIQGEVERTEDIVERIDLWLGCWVSDLIPLWRIFQ